MVVVVAAGNSGANACNESPASAPEAITVGSTTSVDQLSYFSNHGPCVDINAPGSDIPAAYVDSDSSVVSLSGTSMAAPHVAGAGASQASCGRMKKPKKLNFCILNIADYELDTGGKPSTRLLPE